MLVKISTTLMMMVLLNMGFGAVMAACDDGDPSYDEVNPPIGPDHSVLRKAVVGSTREQTAVCHTPKGLAVCAVTVATILLMGSLLKLVGHELKLLLASISLRILCDPIRSFFHVIVLVRYHSSYIKPTANLKCF